MHAHLPHPGTAGPALATALLVVLGAGFAGEGREATIGTGTARGPSITLTADAAVAAGARRAPAGTMPTDGGSTAEATDAGAQPVTLTVGDGPLEVLHDRQPLDLVRDEATGRYTADVDGFALVDARGTDAGWQLQVEVVLPDDDAVQGTRVQVTVLTVRAFARSLAGLTAGGTSAAVGSWGTVARSAAGNSAGCFRVSVRVTWDGPADGPSHVHGTLLARAA